MQKKKSDFYSFTSLFRWSRSDSLKKREINITDELFSYFWQMIKATHFSQQVNTNCFPKGFSLSSCCAFFFLPSSQDHILLWVSDFVIFLVSTLTVYYQQRTHWVRSVSENDICCLREAVELQWSMNEVLRFYPEDTCFTVYNRLKCCSAAGSKSTSSKKKYMFTIRTATHLNSNNRLHLACLDEKLKHLLL